MDTISSNQQITVRQRAILKLHSDSIWSRPHVNQPLSCLNRKATLHDAAHHVFMTLPPYTSTIEGEVRHLRCGPKPCQGGPWSEEMPSFHTVIPLVHALLQQWRAPALA